MSKKRLCAIIAICVIVTFFVTFLGSSALYINLFYKGSGVNFSKLTRIKQVLDKYYYEDYDEAALTDGAAYGMVGALGDPYTTYMNKDEWEDFNTMITGEYCGIGVTVTANPEDNTILIISVFSNSPAEKAGLVAGDKIIAVEGESYTGDKLDAAVSKMKGEPDTEVNITVLKGETNKTEDITITRQEIVMDSVASSMEGDLGYIIISTFDIHTGEEFATHLTDLLDKGAKGIILDLRQNGGGITTACEDVASCLLEEGNTIYYTRDKNGKEVHYKTESDGIDLPIAVLVDENTASAAEILSAAIKDNGKGFIVGTQTFGKGLVQQTVPMGDGSVVKVTVERYFTPNGTDINQKGIEPDYVVEFDAESETDVQFDKAVELLKEKIN